MTRRTLLTVAAGATAIVATSRDGFSQSYDNTSAGGSSGPFQLPPLPYAASALEPSIDAQTVALHHGRHHAAYVANLNQAAKVAPEIAKRPIEHVLSRLGDLPDAVRATVRNNLGGHANHSMYWLVMGGAGGAPTGEAMEAIERDFGGLDDLQRRFNAAGAGVFGSGWVFVTVDRTGRLAIETRPNQDTPLMDGKRVLFGNDLWEHSYYLKYQSRRADYLKAWWDVLNWARIEERYRAARTGELTI